VSLLWLNGNDPTTVAGAVKTLEGNRKAFGGDGGEIFSGKSLSLLFNDPSVDSRTPNIIVAPKVGVTYTGGKGKIAEHGGFANDDTRVMLLVSNPALKSRSVSTPVQTAQVAPTILSILGLDPNALMSVRAEGTQALPGLN
jgi:arylsulfatase A-like enzyme